MTPLEAAKRLMDDEPLDHRDDPPDHWCVYCGGPTGNVTGLTGLLLNHAPDCPWLAMPRIITALEAAEVIAKVGAPIGCCSDECEYCGGRNGLFLSDPVEHKPGCRWVAFAAALLGEEVPV